ncbi:MAG: hypothetical protein ACXVZJ_12475 [Terriglobales bacterium]
MGHTVVRNLKPLMVPVTGTRGLAPDLFHVEGKVHAGDLALAGAE